MKRVFLVLTSLLGSFAFADAAHAQGFLKDGFGKCLHIPQESRQNGVQLRTWDCLDKSHLKWQRLNSAWEISVWDGLTAPTDNPLFPPKSPRIQFLWLKNVMTGKCAAVHKGQKHDGAWVVQWDCSHEPHFQWLWAYGGQLMHRASGKCLHVASGAQYATVTVSQCLNPKDTWNNLLPEKRWGFGYKWNSSDYALVSGLGKCLYADAGIGLATMDCTTYGENKVWVPTRISGNYFSIKNKKSGKCIASQTGDVRGGSDVLQGDCGRAPQERNFQWQLGWDPQFVNRYSGLCLQVASGNKIITQPCIQVPPVPSNLRWTSR